MQVILTVWNGRIAPVFDVARHALLLEIENGRIIVRHNASLCGLGAIQQTNSLMELKPDVLICGAVSKPLLDILSTAGLNIYPFIAGDREDVIQAYLAGTLSSSAHFMPGCCGWQRPCHSPGVRPGRAQNGRHCRRRGHLIQTKD